MLFEELRQPKEATHSEDSRDTSPVQEAKGEVDLLGVWQLRQAVLHCLSANTLGWSNLQSLYDKFLKKNRALA